MLSTLSNNLTPHALTTNLDLKVLLYTCQSRHISEQRTLTFAKVKLTVDDELATVASLMAFAMGVGPQKYVCRPFRSVKWTRKG